MTLGIVPRNQAVEKTSPAPSACENTRTGDLAASCGGLTTFSHSKGEAVRVRDETLDIPACGSFVPNRHLRSSTTTSSGEWIAYPYAWWCQRISIDATCRHRMQGAEATNPLAERFARSTLYADYALYFASVWHFYSSRIGRPKSPQSAPRASSLGSYGIGRLPRRGQLFNVYTTAGLAPEDVVPMRP